MKYISKEELNKILEEHELWLKREGGKRADLSDVDLSCTDLGSANLRCADLSNADLSDVNLRYADLRFINLSKANLKGADLKHAKLTYADLSKANLSKANLKHAKLTYVKLKGADLQDADLRDANLNNADLEDADLTYANLSNADLKYANLSNANLSCADLRYANLKDIKTNINTTGYKLACPEKGSFIGYKKAGGCIIELLILEDAKRSSATTTKCRCSKAKVLDIENIETGEKVEEINSDYDNNFIYRVGEIVYVDNFNEYRWEECTSGIHFFMNKEDAINY